MHCRSDLREVENGLRCTACDTVYEIKDGIPIFLSECHGEERKRYLESYQTLAKDDLQVPLEPYRRSRHAALIDFIGNVKHKRVLDIGSSNAMCLRQLDASFKVAFDLVNSYLAAIPEDDGLVRVCGDAEFLPFKAGFFDVIIVSDILEHLLHPENLIQHLRTICGPRTRLIVHIPWEENLEKYAHSKYEYTHLRSFNAFKFAQFMHGFYVKRERATFPLLDEPLLFKLHGKIPRRLYNLFTFLYITYFQAEASSWQFRRWVRWMNEFPKREWWLLWFYKPVFRIFELRTAKRSVYSVVHRVMRVLQAILALFGQEGKMRGFPR